MSTEDSCPALRTGLVSYRENQRGVSYESLFGAYLEGARTVEIVDPYVRAFHQCRNMMELLQVCSSRSRTCEWGSSLEL